MYESTLSTLIQVPISFNSLCVGTCCWIYKVLFMVYCEMLTVFQLQMLLYIYIRMPLVWCKHCSIFAAFINYCNKSLAPLVLTRWSLRSNLPLSIKPKTQWSLSYQASPSLCPLPYFGAPGRTVSSISIILPRPPKGSKIFQIQQSHTSLHSCYHFTTVLLFACPMFVYLLHCTSVIYWIQLWE